MKAHITLQHIAIETPELTAYYEKAGDMNFTTDESLAIVETMEDGKLYFRFASPAYQDILASVGAPTPRDSEARLNIPESPIRKKSRVCSPMSTIPTCPTPSPIPSMISISG